MSIKKNIILGMVTGLVGMSLISGGTVAYFSDDVSTQNQIMSGTIDLGIKNTSDSEGFYFNFKDKKPGDIFEKYTFQLVNDGTLNIGKLFLNSAYDSFDKDNKPNDFGSQIKIKELKVNGVINTQLTDRTLHQIDAIKNKANSPALLITDIKPNNDVEIEVIFEFIETENQNKYQGNRLDLNWTFEAVQEVEESK